MHTLTGLDASFLYLETPEMPMHVGSFNLCELPAGFKGSFHKAVQKHVRQRLHLAPVFTRQLMRMPLNLGHPAWIDAPAVDIDFHVRRADMAKKGARPMTLAEAHQRCAQLHSELLDRRFPLWEFHVFDRIALPDGRIVVPGEDVPTADKLTELFLPRPQRLFYSPLPQPQRTRRRQIQRVQFQR